MSYPEATGVDMMSKGTGRTKLHHSKSISQRLKRNNSDVLTSTSTTQPSVQNLLENLILSNVDGIDKKTSNEDVTNPPVLKQNFMPRSDENRISDNTINPPPLPPRRNFSQDPQEYDIPNINAITKKPPRKSIGKSIKTSTTTAVRRSASNPAEYRTSNIYETIDCNIDSSQFQTIQSSPSLIRGMIFD